MRIFIILLFLLGFWSFGMTQEIKSDKEVRKEKKEKKRAEKEARADSLYQAVGRTINGRQFTLQAKFLKNRQGARIQVNPTLNFIQISGNRAFLQIGNPSVAGYNAAGGISAEGMITKWKLEQSDKRKTYDLTLSVLLNFGSVDLFMNVNMNGYATATISGYTSAQLTYDGELVPTGQADVQKGWTP